MVAGSNVFHMMSMPVDLQGVQFLADKDLPEVATDEDGNSTSTSPGPTTNFDVSLVYGPVMLSDSTDGVHWRTIQVSTDPVCEPMTPGSHPVPAGRTLLRLLGRAGHALVHVRPACHSRPSGDGHGGRRNRPRQGDHNDCSNPRRGDRLADHCAPVPFEVIAVSPTQYFRNPDIPQ